MSRRRSIELMTVISLLCIVVLYLFGVLRSTLNEEETAAKEGVYETLPKDISTEEPLAHIGEDFLVDEGFHSNLPIVILKIDGEVTQYKDFKNSQEIAYEDIEPYTDGQIWVLDNSNPEKENYLTDSPVYSSNMKIKKRGHTSYYYDKPQYLMKMYDEDGLENKTEIFGMGEGDSWILNGSMADKSMMRNYLSYRIASEVGGGAMAPDCKYCEVVLETESGYEYQGVYLLMETISRGENRVNIDNSKDGEKYTSYIVRRDRYTHFDVMLDTYGRLSGLSAEWIGIKYPAAQKVTEEMKQYIEQDFSRTEQIIYSEDEGVFKAYDKYIEIDSFVDYFLINEFFGNYDAGEHSTYMYKNSGGKLYIGPVWDFDQAMNNYYADEMDPSTLAFQTKPFFEQLSKDTRFIDCLKERYSELRKGPLSEEHVFAVIDETDEYLTSAREREWHRWAADYMDDSMSSMYNYYLQDYEKEDVIISRFNDDYDQELYIIRNYLHKHGNAIQTELTKLYDLAEYNSSMKNENELFLLVIMVLFLVPSILINRKG
ncbi:MAG: CotH kinase family protein [Lachnospiraceae bacterium]|nr:CotH kinase family protein [Lachnospiraceae bacterium]